MPEVELEKRVESLETQVAELREELHQAKGRTGKDWRSTIGAFTDDEGMKDILREAMRLREEDRAKARIENGSQP